MNLKNGIVCSTAELTYKLFTNIPRSVIYAQVSESSTKVMRLEPFAGNISLSSHERSKGSQSSFNRRVNYQKDFIFKRVLEM